MSQLTVPGRARQSPTVEYAPANHPAANGRGLKGRRNVPLSLDSLASSPCRDGGSPPTTAWQGRNQHSLVRGFHPLASSYATSA